jgi:hypothetical protein
MVNIPKMAPFHVKIYQKRIFSWKIFTNCNITVASMVKIPMNLRDFFPCFGENYKPVLGKFPNKVRISMNFSNSAIVSM